MMSPTKYSRCLLVLLLTLTVSLPAREPARASSGADHQGNLSAPSTRADRLQQPHRNNRPDSVPGRLIIRYKPRSSDAERGRLHAAERLEKVRSLKSIGAEIVRVNGRSSQAAIEDLKSRRAVTALGQLLVRNLAHLRD